MDIAALIDSLDGVSEPLKPLYRQRSDGKFELPLDQESLKGHSGTMGLRSALEKERTGNKEKEKQLRELAERYADIDPDKARDLLARADELENKELIKKGDLDALINKREAEIAKRFQDQLKSRETELGAAKLLAEAATQKLHQTMVRTALSRSASEEGVLPEAYEEFELLGLQRFRFVEDKEAVLGFKGDEMEYQGETPLTPSLWARSLKSTKPHLFPVSSGGSSRPGVNRAGGVDLSKMTPVQRMNHARQASK